MLDLVAPVTRAAAQDALDVAEAGYALQWILADLAHSGTPVPPGSFDALIEECDRLVGAGFEPGLLTDYLTPLSQIRYSVTA